MNLPTANFLHCYICLKVYGKEQPDFAMDKPTEGCSSSIKFAQKAISFFMPNRLIHWCNQTKQENPTKSPLVNNLVKCVKKDKVRKEGKAPVQGEQ